MYYHGTSSALGITDRLLPPDNSGKLSEAGRRRNLDKVFVTKDIGSAEIYARKAVKRFGGKPVILTVDPEGDIVTLQSAPGTTVFMACGALVL